MIRAAHIAKAILEYKRRNPDVSSEKLVTGIKTFAQKRGITALLPAVFQNLAAVARQIKAEQGLQIWSATEPNSSEVDAIRDLLNAPADAVLVWNEDPATIGGYRASYNSQMIDTTQSRSVQEFSMHLAS